MAGYVCSPDEILATQPDDIERELAMVPAPPAAPPEADDVKIGHLAGRVLMALEQRRGMADIVAHRLLLVPGRHYILVEDQQEEDSCIAPMYPFDFTTAGCRFYQIPQKHGKYLAAVDGLVREEIFSRYLCNSAARQSWRELFLTLSSEPSDVHNAGGQGLWNWGDLFPVSIPTVLPAPITEDSDW